MKKKQIIRLIRARGRGAGHRYPAERLVYRQWGPPPGNIWETIASSIAEAATARLTAYTGLFWALFQSFDCFIQAFCRMIKAVTEALYEHSDKTNS
jgi:hypothetical protein